MSACLAAAWQAGMAANTGRKMIDKPVRACSSLAHAEMVIGANAPPDLILMRPLTACDQMPVSIASM